MRQKIFYGILLSIVFLIAKSCIKSCSRNENSDINANQMEIDSQKYPDGTYSADVEYYNNNTGTRNSYKLNVEVEGHKITLIHWPNGGWLDDSHFDPEELDNFGTCSFTSDAGYEYSIKITGPETAYPDKISVNNIDESSYSNDDINRNNLDDSSITCPECGEFKYSDSELCPRCKNAITCPLCRNWKEKKDKFCVDCREKLNICPLCHKYDSTLYERGGVCDECK